jgi:hypothetical protein
VAGRRFYSRFLSLIPSKGYMRISQDVTVHLTQSGELAVISDTPGVADEELTLVLVSSAGEVALRVRVRDSAPEIVGGVLRHRVHLDLLGAEVPRRSENPWSTHQ